LPTVTVHYCSFLYYKSQSTEPDCNTQRPCINPEPYRQDSTTFTNNHYDAKQHVNAVIVVGRVMTLCVLTHSKSYAVFVVQQQVSSMSSMFVYSMWCLTCRRVTLGTLQRQCQRRQRQLVLKVMLRDYRYTPPTSLHNHLS